MAYMSAREKPQIICTTAIATCAINLLRSVNNKRRYSSSTRRRSTGRDTLKTKRRDSTSSVLWKILRPRVRCHTLIKVIETSLLLRILCASEVVSTLPSRVNHSARKLNSNRTLSHLDRRKVNKTVLDSPRRRLS